MLKKHLVFLIEETDGEKFVYYVNTEIGKDERRGAGLRGTDKGSFQFNLESNGRLSGPMKFEVLDTNEIGCELLDNSHRFLIQLGDMCIIKENCLVNCAITQYSSSFNYRGTQESMIEIRRGCRSRIAFSIKRFIVIQMK